MIEKYQVKCNKIHETYYWLLLGQFILLFKDIMLIYHAKKEKA